MQYGFVYDGKDAQDIARRWNEASCTFSTTSIRTVLFLSNSASTCQACSWVSHKMRSRKAKVSNTDPYIYHWYSFFVSTPITISTSARSIKKTFDSLGTRSTLDRAIDRAGSGWYAHPYGKVQQFFALSAIDQQIHFSNPCSCCIL